MKEYIEVGKLNKELFNKINKSIITDEVIFTYERVNHVETRRLKLFDEVRKFLPEVLYDPDRIYKDWNNRDNTIVIIKTIDEEAKLNVVVKIAVENDEKHPKNSIITMIKIGEKTFKKIDNNKKDNLLYDKKLDKNE